MELERETQIKLRHLLRQKRNVDRFRARRSYDRLAMDLGVSKVTLVQSMNRPRASGKLSREAIEWAKMMRAEYNKHRKEFKLWSHDGIAKTLGVHVRTVDRWFERILNER